MSDKSKPTSGNLDTLRHDESASGRVDEIRVRQNPGACQVIKIEYGGARVL